MEWLKNIIGKEVRVWVAIGASYRERIIGKLEEVQDDGIVVSYHRNIPLFRLTKVHFVPYHYLQGVKCR